MKGAEALTDPGLELGTDLRTDEYLPLEGWTVFFSVGHSLLPQGLIAAGVFFSLGTAVVASCCMVEDWLLGPT